MHTLLTDLKQTIPPSPEKNKVVPLAVRLLTHLRTPLFLNGYALVISALTSSGLGMIYWILAAHLYPPEVVGLNSAVISAMMFLAGIAQLNLNNVLIRFIRTAGRFTNRFVVFVYLIAITIAGCAGFIFILETGQWTPELGFIKFNTLFAAWFLISTITWSIFGLQDGNMTGLRRATWVPIKNITYAMVKIVLMVLLAASIPFLGIFAAWTLAAAIIILPTHFFIFKVLLPAQSGIEESSQPGLVTDRVVKFIVADNLGGLSWIACTYLLPVIVATRIGAAANAYYYLAWTIANTIFMITPNIGSSFVVETSSQPEKIKANLGQVSKQVARLVIPIVMVVTIGAPLILRIFGNNYSLEGTLLLRLLALATIPNMIVSLYINVARVQQRRLTLLVMQLSSSGSIMVLSFIFLSLYGIVGVGWAFLTSQTALALVITATQTKTIRSILSEYRTVNGRYGREKNNVIAKVASQYQANRRRYRMAFHQARTHFRAYLQARRITDILPAILETIPLEPHHPHPTTWKELYPVPTVNDQQVYFIGPKDHLPLAVLKIPMTGRAFNGLINEISTIDALQEDHRLDRWRGVIPRVMVSDKIGHQFYLVERVLSGVTAYQLLKKNRDYEGIQETAASAISELHRRTATSEEIGPIHLCRWVDEPIAGLQRAVAAEPHREQLDELNRRLSKMLVGHQVSLGWIHGDFAPGNILMTWDGKLVTGIVDWELAEKDHLPLMDLYMLLLTTRMILQRREIGELVCSQLQGEQWTKKEKMLIAKSQEMLPGDPIEPDAILLLCWLHHISTNLTKSGRYHTQRGWARENILPVLDLLK